MTIDKKSLVLRAEAARKYAYAPYSRFKVGAALLAASGKVYTGCNVENASYGATVCAERTALFKAISRGDRSFVAIAVTAGETACPPCGICRQTLAEFCPPEFEIITADGDKIESKSLGELLPFAFDKERIKQRSNR